MIFKIDGFREQFKHEDIIALQDVVDCYLIVESGMIMKVVIGFKKC